MTTVNGTAASASSLKIKYSELRREIGRFLGFSRTPADWDATQTSDVADVIRGGYRNVCWPTAMEGTPVHKWTWLCPSATISIVPGTRVYDLPYDFVRVCSPFTYSYNDNGGIVAQSDDFKLRSLYSSEALNGIPKYCAIRPKSQEEDSYELLVYPTPDAAMTIEYRYEKVPVELGESNPYHLGSAAYSELVLASCLMIADKMLNKESLDPSGGLHAQRYAELLKASILIDMQVQVQYE